jgi:repeat uncharacterized protein DUF347
LSRSRHDHDCHGRRRSFARPPDAQQGSRSHPVLLACWLAYILTRPLGASIGDEMSQNSHKYGGLGLGTTGTSHIFPGGILALVTYLSITRRDATEVKRTPIPDAA